MVEQEIIDEVKRFISGGYDKHTIIQTLEGLGYTAKEIVEIIAAATPAQETAEKPRREVPKIEEEEELPEGFAKAPEEEKEEEIPPEAELALEFEEELGALEGPQVVKPLPLARKPAKKEVPAAPEKARTPAPKPVQEPPAGEEQVQKKRATMSIVIFIVVFVIIGLLAYLAAPKLGIKVPF
ncbi:MAG: hypothetical protein JW834_03350 [Candidatus Diapherotrites archaeon]|nr:hypothetical protein [Candidatus Diapherotrites archaeon]